MLHTPFAVVVLGFLCLWKEISRAVWPGETWTSVVMLSSISRGSNRSGRSSRLIPGAIELDPTQQGLCGLGIRALMVTHMI